jgi:hypothetical protein
MKSGAVELSVIGAQQPPATYYDCVLFRIYSDIECVISKGAVTYV